MLNFKARRLKIKNFKFSKNSDLFLLFSPIFLFLFLLFSFFCPRLKEVVTRFSDDKSEIITGSRLNCVITRKNKENKTTQRKKKKKKKTKNKIYIYIYIYILEIQARQRRAQEILA